MEKPKIIHCEEATIKADGSILVKMGMSEDNMLIIPAALRTEGI